MTSNDDPKLAYLARSSSSRRRPSSTLRNQADNLTRFYRELEEMHDFVHEIYPAG